MENEIYLISLLLLNYTNGGGGAQSVKGTTFKGIIFFLIEMQIPSALGWCNRSNPNMPCQHRHGKPHDPHFASYLFSLSSSFLLHWTLTIDEVQTIYGMLLTTAEGHSCFQTDRSTCLNQQWADDRKLKQTVQHCGRWDVAGSTVICSECPHTALIGSISFHSQTNRRQSPLTPSLQSSIAYKSSITILKNSVLHEIHS